MTSEFDAEYDLVLMGMGIRGVAHLTLEAIGFLNRCRQGYMVGLSQEEVDEFARGLHETLAGAVNIPPLESLSRAYQLGRNRALNYRDAARIILDALGRGGPVAYLTPGNPMTFDSVTQLLLEEASLQGYRVRIASGISSLDTILVDLRVEMAPGMQVYDVSWAVAGHARLDTRFACLLLQSSVLLTRWPTVEKPARQMAIDTLKSYLLHFYPGDHQLALVRSGYQWLDCATVLWQPIDELGEELFEDYLGCSIWLPPLHQIELNSALA
jgi:precorrin-2 methylase